MTNARGRIVVGLCTALITSGIALGSGIASAADKDCKDFSSQAAAQAYFSSNGGSATNNFNNLDANHNGIACEDYPYSSTSPITSSSTSTSTSPTTSPTTSSSTEVSSGSSSSSADDGSTAVTDGSQVSVVPEGSANTGSW